MSAPKSPREPDAMRQVKTDGVPMARAMGSAAHEAAAVPEPPQVAAALAKAVDDIKPSEAHLRQILDTLPILAWCHLPDGSNAFFNQRWQTIRVSHRRRPTAGDGTSPFIPTISGG